MRVLLDADLPHSAAVPFEAHGHDAVHVRDVRLLAASDLRIFLYATTHHRLVVTRDLDFSDIRRYPFSQVGVIVLRVPPEWTAAQINRTLDVFLQKVNPAHLGKALTIVEPGGYRIRR